MILVLGIGNTLLRDDGAGVHVVEALRRRSGLDHLALRDGGTLGLTLLPEIEQAEALIAVDAGETGAAPGSIRIFEGDAMDQHLRGKKRTVHEVALDDLMAAAALMGRKPARRALIVIQPASTDWGVEPGEAVADAIPAACDAVLSLSARWSETG